MTETVLNIESILEMGEIAERAFFNYLQDENIVWRPFANLNYIKILNQDVSTILGYWPECKIEE